MYISVSNDIVVFSYCFVNRLAVARLLLYFGACAQFRLPSLHDYTLESLLADVSNSSPYWNSMLQLIVTAHLSLPFSHNALVFHLRPCLHQASKVSSLFVNYCRYAAQTLASTQSTMVISSIIRSSSDEGDDAAEVLLLCVAGHAWRYFYCPLHSFNVAVARIVGWGMQQSVDGVRLHTSKHRPERS